MIYVDRPGLRGVELVDKLQSSISRCLQSALAVSHSADPSTFAKLLIKVSDLRTLNTIHSEKLLGMFLLKYVGYSSLLFKITSPLREITCHMGSHSVTCHPAAVTFPRSLRAKGGAGFSNPGGMQGWVDLVMVISQDRFTLEIRLSTLCPIKKCSHFFNNSDKC